jgi:predicted dehydrogenase
VLLSSETDSFGGPESLAEIRLQHGNCAIRLKLSWLSQLANQYTIVGREGAIRGSINHPDRVNVTARSGRGKQIRFRHCERNYDEFGRRMVANFVDVIAKRSPPLVPAKAVLPALELLEECYEAATRLPMPWLQPEEFLRHA